MRIARSASEVFGSRVFHEQAMRHWISKDAFIQWEKCMTEHIPLHISAANEIAQAMKQWAVSLGAKYFAHWFQPLTSTTAEKHEGFLTPLGNGQSLLSFSGKELLYGEPDASSFPSGGLRAIFRARGYTAWDPSAFAFVKNETLYIPAVFCSFNGEALDKKIPLLRSMDAMSHQAVRVLRLLGDHRTKRVVAQVGAEQEYFLVDEKLYRQREDLRLCARTLFGAAPPRGQESGSHYCGSIHPRVAAYMRELDGELWKLGVPVSTHHNERAPAQYEMAVVYSDANTACDQNQIVMEMMKKIAHRHGFACLLHEKPFAHVNGSGKHNNWSLATDQGQNLFEPGLTPAQNISFLLFLAAFIKGVDDYQDLIRATVSFAGNDERLGGHEAPPPILSVFLGDELEAVVDSIVSGKEHRPRTRQMLKIGVEGFTPIPQGNTDRNRTSPMAFTGNKFEFRMPGSMQSLSEPNTVLNTIMAEELKQFADDLENAADLQKESWILVKKVFASHRRILFGGNGYDAMWEAEAKKRQLSVLHSTADALRAYIAPQNVELFIKHGIYTQNEIQAQYAVHMEQYVMTMDVEAKTMIDMARRQILPAVCEYADTLCRCAAHKKMVGADPYFEKSTAEKISKKAGKLLKACEQLEASLKCRPAEPEKAMRYSRDVLHKEMNIMRRLADELEILSAADRWPIPVYSELLEL